MSIRRNILLTPGPATTTDSVKMAQVVPDICPRETEFCDLVRGIRSDLVRLAGGEPDRHACVLFSGSGTSGMEAMIASSAPAGGRIAVVVNGAYGQRLADIATLHGLRPLVIPFAPTEPASPRIIADALTGHPDLRALVVVHHETTTVLVNPIRAIGAIARDRDVMFLVDAISSLGGMPVHMADDHIDAFVSVSNKSLQGMAGVAFVMADRAALERMRGYPRRCYYLDLVGQFDSLENSGQFRFTAPVSALYALRRALDELTAEGVSARWDRYRENARILREGLRQRGFRLLLDDAIASGMMTSVLEPEAPGWSFAAFHDHLLQRGITIYPGKVSTLPTFRLATIGDLHPGDLRAVLEAMDEALGAMRCTLRA